MNKKGNENLLMNNINWLLLVIVIVVGLFFLLRGVGGEDKLYEQIYAKKIALMINKAKIGTELEIDVFEIHNIARKNKFSGNIVSIDNQKNEVRVQLSNSGAYIYQFFNEADVIWNIRDNGILKLKMIKGENV